MAQDIKTIALKHYGSMTRVTMYDAHDQQITTRKEQFSTLMHATRYYVEQYGCEDDVTLQVELTMRPLSGSPTATITVTP